MIEKHFDICVKKIDRELKEPYGKNNKDGDFIPFTWDELAEYLNNDSEDRPYKSGDYLRCLAKQERYNRGMVPQLESQFQEEKEKLFAERLKTKAHNRVLNKKLKQLATGDIFNETLIEVSKNLEKHSYKTPESKVGKGDCTIILPLCDWHYGSNIDNFMNKFNKEIFVNRVQKLIDETCYMCEKFDVEKIKLLNLNDLISGYIHTSIRIMNDDDTVTQLMFVIDTLCEMIQILSKYAEIDYMEVLDNHSRLTAKKEDAISSENLSRMISFTLGHVFKNNKRVHFVENKYGADISTFNVYNWNYAAVHGHLDKLNTVVQDISLMTKEFYNVIFMAHKHHFMADEIHGTYVYSSGCLVGTDEYSKDLRFSSNPSQNIFLVTKEDPCYIIRTVKF